MTPDACVAARVEGAGAFSGGLALAAGCAGIAVLPLLLVDSLAELPLRPLCLLSLVFVTFVLVAIALMSRRRVQGLPFIYGLVFAAFHFGLTGAYALGYDVVRHGPDPWAYLWFLDPTTPRAILLATSGMGGFGLAVVLQSLRTPSIRAIRRSALDDLPGGMLGLCLLALSITGWFAMVLGHGGRGLLVVSYGEFLGSMRGVPLMFADFGIGIGMALLYAGDAGVVRRLGTAMFAVWAAVAFPLGLRGDVLFPLAGALAVASLRRPALGPRRLILLSLAILVAITLARQLRQVGLFGMDHAALSANPVDALAEMGSSLRPVHIALGWAENGDPPLLGLSYWAPVERILHYLLPLWERLPSTEDPRLLNVLVQSRVGQVGFSPIAEAFLNFRWLGPVLIMFAIGALLAWVDRLPPTRANQLLAAPIIVPLMLQVRNAFSQVPGQILVGYIILAAGVTARAFWQILRCRRCAGAR